MRTNVKVKQPPKFTHEGAVASRIRPPQELRRTVMSCLLWEDEFYEDGKTIAARIAETAEKVSPDRLAAIAIEARTSFNLRHVPLLLLEVLSRTLARSQAQSQSQSQPQEPQPEPERNPPSDIAA